MKPLVMKTELNLSMLRRQTTSRYFQHQGDLHWRSCVNAVGAGNIRHHEKRAAQPTAMEANRKRAFRRPAALAI